MPMNAAIGYFRLIYLIGNYTELRCGATWMDISLVVIRQA